VAAVSASIQEHVTMLQNRLRKNARHRRKWARKESISCYRLYDRDIPEIPFSVDWYDGRLSIAEYERPGSPTEDEHEPWIHGLLTGAGEALEVAHDQIFLKRRERQRGTRQYEKVARQSARFTVEEGGYEFVVNLSDYLDTGLFLDHRQTRAMVANEADGARFLNLFGYTGSFTVYAAGAGAVTSITVDLSNTYLEWTAENLHNNFLDTPKHELVRMDVGEFLKEAYLRKEQFDLIVVDPPTFSNSKKMDGVFDIHRDHDSLLRAVHHVTAPGGVVYFSTNARRFTLTDELSFQRVTDITHQTVLVDFQQRQPHWAWRMERA